jgi:hypothetical protein
MESEQTIKKGFFKHVFNFDEKTKSEVLNIVQYSLLAVIPIIILNKISQKYVPEANEENGSFEILAEVIGQILLLFLGIFLINRIITYVPTYSGESYPDFNVIYIILAVLMIVLSLQTKLGEKVNLLSERVIELWDGQMNDKGNRKKSNGQISSVRISQPISGQHKESFQMPSQMPSQMPGQMKGQMPKMKDTGNTTSIDQLPSMPNIKEQKPDFNSMYRNDSNPLQGASFPPPGMNDGPMAANDAVGSAFGSSFGSGF